ncbi:MAG: preprotein translocase subunit SecG [Armatimonadota bacterium]
MNIISVILSAVQLLSAVLLIFFVMSQTTKSEGLTGTIGGKMASSFRGKPGWDDKMSIYTKWSAIIFGISSMLVYLVSTRI